MNTRNKKHTFIKVIFVISAVYILIFASACGGTSDSYLTLSQSEATAYVGRSITLTAQSSSDKITWISSDDTVATVNGGVVVGIREGAVTITVKSGTKMATCEVTVIRLPESGKGAYPELVWNDEFDGSSLDMTKWSYQTGTKDTEYGGSNNNYWGNNEQQYYNEENVAVSDGCLNITAKREKKGDRDFTSGRITTRGKFTQVYGYFEARIKAPAIDGMWPAFWMLPQPTNTSSSTNIYGGWPANGEIDIMEIKGRLGNRVDTTLHFGDTWQSEDTAGTTTVLSSDVDEWHTYAVEWTEKFIAFIVDDGEVYRVDSTRWWTSASEKESAPFDQPFYMLLNLAVGGNYDGGIMPPASFTSATMSVDYVRVYK